MQTSIDAGSYSAFSGCTSDGSGAVSCSFTVPAGLAAGTHALALKDGSGNISATSNFTVTPDGLVTDDHFTRLYLPE